MASGSRGCTPSSTWWRPSASAAASGTASTRPSWPPACRSCRSSRASSRTTPSPPGCPVRDVLTAMGRTWAELDQLERRNGLSFLREPDSGFVWAAYRWVRGAKLEDVLDSVPGLTPGDFVRSVKQLIDLLDQIAAAASYDANGKPATRAKTRSVPS